MAKVTNKTKGFNSISREVVFDSELSDRARFLYVYMACKPEDWEFFQENIAHEIGYETRTVRKYLDELIYRGWLTEEEQQNSGGSFGALKYTIEIERKKGNKPIRKNSDTQKMRNAKNANHKDIDNISSEHSSSDNKRDIEEKSLSNDKQKIEYSEEFYQLWIKYKEGTKSAAFKAWNKLTAKERQAALDKVDDYLTYCRRKGREKKDTSSYLNQKCFNEDTWTKIPECYVLVDGENERIAGFKSWMCREFADLIYHRKPLTFEQMNECIEKYRFNQTEWAMRQLCKRDIHQYYSIAQGIEKVIMEELPEFAEQ